MYKFWMWVNGEAVWYKIFYREFGLAKPRGNVNNKVFYISRHHFVERFGDSLVVLADNKLSIETFNKKKAREV